MGFKGINQVAEQSSVDVNLTVKCHGSENLSLIPGSATSGHVKTGTRPHFFEPVYLSTERGPNINTSTALAKPVQEQLYCADGERDSRRYRDVIVVCARHQTTTRKP